MDRLDTWIKIAVALVAAVWGGLTPLVQLLIVLMVMDFATGLLSGFVAKQLSSNVSFRGLAKKMIVLLIVAAGGYMEPVVQLPLGSVIAGFYCAGELLSIIENTAAAGLPVPDILKEALKKLAPETDVVGLVKDGTGKD